MLSTKLIKETHDFIASKLDPIIHEIDLEREQDRELENAYKDAMRAENLIKFKNEIMSRPKTEWHSSNKQRAELKRDSKRDLQNIRRKSCPTLTIQFSGFFSILT